MRSYDHFLEEEGAVFPGKTYVEALLKPVFNDQRDYLFTVMFDIHRAHVVMLAEQGILDVEEARTILKAVNKVAQIDVSTLQYDPDFEDLFFMMEAKIGEEIGGDLAGKMHIGRSRNDMGVAMYRLVLRTRLLHFIEHAYQLSETILHQAEKHKETYMTGYTHTQPAQPTTLGHYLLAVFDVLQRDVKRLWSAYKTVNRSPLGAAYHIGQGESGVFTVGWELFFPGVEDGHNVGVIQGGGRVGLPAEASLELRVARQVGAHHFDSDGATQSVVTTEVNVRHATATDQLADLITVINNSLLGHVFPYRALCHGTVVIVITGTRTALLD